MKSPFKFLDAYTLQDKDAFFGRDLEIETLYTLVFKTPLLLVYGLSGTGKTSLIQCGLASRFDGPDWYPVFIRRNDDINDSINTVMKNTLGAGATNNLVDNVSLLMRKTLRPVYLLFDQFEELFVLGSDDEQMTFMKSLRELLDAQLPSKVILIMREEYIAQLYSYEKMIPELFDHRFRVEPMGPSKVKSVIKSSFEKFNIQLAEPKDVLLESMVQNINDPRSGITLPYLQVYLDMLYRDKYRKQYPQGTTEIFPKIEITSNEVEHIGKIENVLERFLEDQITELQGQLSKNYKYVKPNAVQSLLDIFVSDEGTKRPIRYQQSGTQITLVDEVAESIQDIPAPMLTEMLESLQQDRILRKSDDHFELAHDSLAMIIDSKRSDYQRQLQSVRKRLSNAFEEYTKTGAFLNQKQLVSFEEYLPYLGLSREMKQFLDKCADEVKRKESEEKDRLHQEHKIEQQKKLARTRKTWLVLATCLAALAGIMALRSYNKAVKLKKQTEMLEIQTNISEMKADSINTILSKVEGQFGRMDSIVRGELDDIELGKTVITLKSLVKGGSTNLDETAKYYCSVIRMFTTDSLSKEMEKSQEISIFQPTSTIYVVLHLNTPLRKEFIQIQWMKDSLQFGKQDIDVPSGDDKTNWVVGSMDAHNSSTTGFGEAIGTNTPVHILSDGNDDIDPGKYHVEVYNSLGVMIGGKDFEVQGVSEAQASVTSKDMFFTTTSYNKETKKPGKPALIFKVNQAIYYVGNINSPKDVDDVYVKLIENSTGKLLWNIPHKIGRNMTGAGYRIWNARSIKEPGAYYIKLENSQGMEMAGFEITVE